MAEDRAKGGYGYNGTEMMTASQSLHDLFLCINE
jgi:hypothetical protein